MLAGFKSASWSVGGGRWAVRGASGGSSYPAPVPAAVVRHGAGVEQIPAPGSVSLRSVALLHALGGSDRRGERFLKFRRAGDRPAGDIPMDHPAPYSAALLALAGQSTRRPVAVLLFFNAALKFEKRMARMPEPHANLAGHHPTTAESDIAVQALHLQRWRCQQQSSPSMAEMARSS